VLAGSLAAITGPVALPDALPEAVRDAIALCLRADRAEWAVESLGLRPDLFPADGSVSA
jgi:hypothetical protein